jgi:hypothetical protein
VYEEGDNEDEVEDEDDLYFEESDEEVSDLASVGTSGARRGRVSCVARLMCTSRTPPRLNRDVSRSETVVVTRVLA